MWQYGAVSSVPTEWLVNWFRALAQLLRPGYCPLTRHNPGMVPAFLLDTVP